MFYEYSELETLELALEASVYYIWKDRSYSP